MKLKIVDPEAENSNGSFGISDERASELAEFCKIHFREYRKAHEGKMNICNVIVEIVNSLTDEQEQAHVLLIIGHATGQ
jgi:hypothetical protein